MKKSCRETPMSDLTDSVRREIFLESYIYIHEVAPLLGMPINCMTDGDGKILKNWTTTVSTVETNAHESCFVTSCCI